MRRTRQPLPWAIAAVMDLELADTTRRPDVGCSAPSNVGLLRFANGRPDLLLGCDVVRDSVVYYVYARPATGEILAAGRELEVEESRTAVVLDSLAAIVQRRLGQGKTCKVPHEGQRGMRWLVPDATVLLVATDADGPITINLEAQRGHVTCGDVTFAPGITL